jgi:type II secretory pathway pseudopilin PulG
VVSPVAYLAPIKEWSAKKSAWAAPRKFQSLDDARRHIERRQAARAKRQAQQQYYTQQQELPRVVQLVQVPVQG